MTDIEFGARVFKINKERDKGNLGALTAGKLYRDLCREWLQDHDKLPEGFEGFADKED